MATPGEVLWVGMLSTCGKMPLQSTVRNDDIATLRARPHGENWVTVFSESSSTFRLRDFSVSSLERRTPRLQLSFLRYSLGRPPVLFTIKVIWPCKFILNSLGYWECKFLYNPKVIRFKILPQRIENFRNIKLPEFKSISLSGDTPIPRLCQKADNLLGPRVRVSTRARNRRISMTKTSGRPSPESRLGSAVIGFEDTGTGWIPQGTQPYESLNRTHSGPNRTPNYGSLPSNKLPVNPFACVLVKTKDGQALHFRNIAGPGYGFTYPQYHNVVGRTSGLFDPAIPSIASGFNLSNVKNKAISNLRERCDQNVSNIAVDIAEFRQFNSLVGNSTFRIISSLKQLRRGNLVGASDALIAGRRIQHRFGGRLSRSKTLAQNWLELQYGWKPLLADIVDGHERLRQYVLKNSVVRSVRASSRWSNRVTGTISDVLLPTLDGTKPLTTIGSFETLFDTHVKYSIRFRVSDHFKNLAQQTGFNNPINLFWELLPFSFVVDWFLPIGPYLEGLSANQGLTFMDGSETRFLRQEHSAIISFAGMRPRDNGWVDRVSGSYSRTWIKFDREKLLTFPSQTFPMLKSPVTVTHTLNALALMRVLMKE